MHLINKETYGLDCKIRESLNLKFVELLLKLELLLLVADILDDAELLLIIGDGTSVRSNGNVKKVQVA